MKKRVVMRKCELCDSTAKMYCEADEANLCWNCDAQVHSANFLVSNHSRTLLCHVCQSLTPWNGSGPKFCPTVSVCENCANGCDQNDDSNQENGGDDDEDNNDPDQFDGHEEQNDLEEQREEENENENDDEDKDEENQVVPWSSMSPPPASSTSTSEDLSLSRPQPAFSCKQLRYNVDSFAQDDIN